MTAVDRILRTLGLPDLVARLAELPGSDLTSLLLEVLRRREVGLAELARERPLVAPSAADGRILNLFDHVAMATATGFEAVELSPVVPQGIHRALSGIDQNNVLSTVRQADVLADPTVGQALECARRRKRDRTGVVRLCGAHRCVRMQPIQPPFTPHFRLFSLCSAGRDTGSFEFEIAALREHIDFYLRLFRALEPHGFRFVDPLVELSDSEAVGAILDHAGIDRETVRRAVRPHLPGSGARFLAEHPLDTNVDLPPQPRARLRRMQAIPGVRIDLTRLEGLGYYRGPMLRITVGAPDGQRFALADGGFVDWTQRLLGDRKERLLCSGLGSELACKRFRSSA